MKKTIKMIFEDSKWFNAVTLAERANALENSKNNLKKRSRTSSNSDLSHRNLMKWTKQHSYMSDEMLTQRLLFDNLDENKLYRILGQTPSNIKKQFSTQPDWLVQIETAFSHYTDKNRGINEAVDDQTSNRSGFEALFNPIIYDGRKRFIKGIEELSNTYQILPFKSSNVETLFLEKILQNLAFIAHKTLALEVNVARLRGELKGGSPNERFRYFVDKLYDPQVSLAILKEYSVLARQAVIHINKWIDTSLEFLNHLCEDWNEICETFNVGKSLGLLEHLDIGAGDSHRGGRSVIIIKFNSGIKLVYKPRSLANDVHFQDLLSWLNKFGNQPPFKTLKVLSYDLHGWVEFVENDGCNSEQEVKNFYIRQGCFLALLYALEATDFHAENLIANGEHPILVDLESLFHPRVKEDKNSNYTQKVSAQMGDSVLRVGLLPQRLWIGGKENVKGIDLSGLGGQAGQTTPFKVPQWEKTDTDEVHMVRKSVKIPGNQNRPQIIGKDINPLKYNENVIEGFTLMYNLLKKQQGKILSEEGPIEKFAFNEIRYIARPTRTYSLMLNESVHPDLLRNALDRDQFFDRLWIGVTNQPYLAKIIQAEAKDLCEGDIPIFSTQPNSLNIYSSSGECIPNFLETSALDLVKKRIASFCETDLEKQLWFIRASYASLSTELDGASSFKGYALLESKTEVGSKELLAAAKDVGDRLILLANNNENFVSWTGVSLIGENTWTLSPLGIDLYNGLPGIIVFLAHLGLHTNESKYTDFARLAFESLKIRLSEMNNRVKAIGGFDGLGGLLYFYLHLGVIWQDSELLLEAETYVEKIQGLIEEDKTFDVIGGTAGAIWALYSMHQCKPSERVVNCIVQCADHLINHAKHLETGVVWETNLSNIPLSGISHGQAGIAYALLIAFSVSGKSCFRDVAAGAIAYERTLFSPKLENWVDLREKDENSLIIENDSTIHSMTAWCHGAPGIGIARLWSLQHIEDPIIQEEIKIAVKTTLSTGFGQNHSLCHGDLGNLDFLLQVRQKSNFIDVNAQIKNITSLVYKNISEGGWLCGLPISVETPGFMTGLAGIGYGLLRLIDPEKTPSVLIFEPPVSN